MKHTSKRTNAQVQMISSMIIFGTISIFVKSISLSSGEIALFRALIATAAIICFLLASKKRIQIKVTKREGVLLLFSGIAMAFNWILLFQAYHYTSVSIATLSYYFSPVIVTIMSSILFHEKLTKRQLFCFIMTSIGLVLVMDLSSFRSGSNDLIGVLLGLGAAVLYAVVVLINKGITNVTGIERTVCQFGAAIVVLLPYVITTTGLSITKVDAKGFIHLLILGLVHTGFAYCLYFSAVKDLEGQRVAIFSYIDPLVAVIVSVTVLSETIRISQIIGGAMILGFTLWNEIKKV